jgi:hypothetical protein
MSTLATEADALALELIEASDRPNRVLAIAANLAALAVRIRHQEAGEVPANLRAHPADFPPGVAAIWMDGRWHERPRRSRA